MVDLHNMVTPEDDFQAILDAARPGDLILLSAGDFRAKCTLFVPGVTIRGAGADKTRILWDDYAEKIHRDGKAYNTLENRI